MRIFVSLLLLVQIFILGVATWSDFRDRSNIPNPIAFAPLAAGLVFGCLFGSTILSVVSAVASVLLFLFEYSLRWIPFAIIGAGFLILFFFGAPVLAVSFAALGLLYFANIAGSADSLAVMGCLMISPSIEMAICLVFGLGLAALVCSVIVYRSKIFSAVGDAFRRTVSGRLPSERELHSVGQPTLWGVLVGFVWFLVRFYLPLAARG